jgi:protein involved in polysaccharide export with SLBB domain
MRRTWRRCRHPLPARNTFVTIALLVALLVFLPQTSSAQNAQDASGLYQSRAQLVELEKEYAGIAASPAYSSALRDEANQTLERIRQRLQNGDFQSGDRIIVQIRGENVPDEVVVEAGQLITLPVIGQISLAGVLRAELEEHLIKELGRFIQSPVAQATSTIRLLVQGAVGRPGFYVLPATVLLSDVVMAAGGPAPSADLDNIHIERGDRIVLSPEATRPAVVAGLSLDQLNLQAGDEVQVPVRTTSQIPTLLMRYGLIILSTMLLGYRVF